VSTGPIIGGVRRRVSDRSWQRTAAAGALALGVLAVAMDGGAGLLVAALGLLAVLAGAYVLAPRAIAAVRRTHGWIAFAVLVTAAGIWFAAWFLRVSASAPGTRVRSAFRFEGLPLLPLLAIALASCAGMLLLADAVRVWLGLAPRQRAPWKQMTDVPARAGAIVPRVAAGVPLIGFAALLALAVAGQRFHLRGGVQLFALVLIFAGTLVVLGTPLAIGALMRVDRDKAGSAHDRERQRFAAHLHDSVLQTLALVQRQAHDPVAVARLARRQEHALRAWMAGEAELVSDTLVAALRDVIATVEDEYDLTIEFTAIGDQALNGSGEELVAAAREALRNAARHATDAPVFVFCHVSGQGVEVFVRDEGPGFDIDGVPAERRGIRDAIVGRMAFAGGWATVESVPGEGTEVAMRIGARKGGR
jgi:signal transduction histidine kinase